MLTKPMPETAPWKLRVSAVFALAAGALMLLGCETREPLVPAVPRVDLSTPVAPPITPAPNVPGDPNNGRRLLTAKGCNGCHTVYSVPGMTGTVGPNLTNFTLRPTIAGDASGITNSPDNLVRWIMNPPALKQGALMPVLGINEQEARDLAAFFYSQPYNPPR